MLILLLRDEESESSEDEDESGTEEDMIAHLSQPAPRVAMEAHRRRQAISSADSDSAASHENNDTESEEDTASDTGSDTEGQEAEDRNNQRPSVSSPPPTPRSRSINIDPDTHGYTTPPMANFSIQDITSPSQDEYDSDSDDDDCSVIFPSAYSEASSSPPRFESTFAKRDYDTIYPSPTSTPGHHEDEIALSIEFENLGCVGVREKEERDREVWLRKERERAELSWAGMALSGARLCM